MKIVYKNYWKLTIFGFACVAFLAVCLLYSMIPDQIYISEGDVSSIRFEAPVTSRLVDTQVEVFDSLVEKQDTQAVHITGNSYISTEKTGTFTIVCSLFGLIPMKEVQASIVEEQTVLAGGETAGIYVKTDGVLVIGTGVVQSITGEEREPAENLVKSGDYITKVNGQPMEEKEQLVDYLNENGKEEIVLTLRRDGEEIEAAVTPVLCEDKTYKIGVWVRDDIAGIGTIAYVTQENEYGILGHPISDVDTGTVVEMESGTLYEANILEVEAGKIGTPGEIIGSITYNAEHELGTVENNTQTGVFGTLDVSAWEQFSTNQTDWYPAAFKQEIELGSAQMISDVSGERKAYEVEILSLDYSEQHANKGILLQITDEELLNSTGGIVQGMSGSPLIQNGKIIGAVTHVFVNDPTKGYGVFIENMLEPTQQ